VFVRASVHRHRNQPPHGGRVAHAQVASTSQGGATHDGAMTRRLQSPEWQRLRRLYAHSLPVVCERCGRVVNRTDRWELDHRIPRARGGAWFDPGNLRAVHAACNRADSWRLAVLSRDGRRTFVPSRQW
jgi:5-methylcytosine-specific restriction endonuclease McrA